MATGVGHSVTIRTVVWRMNERLSVDGLAQSCVAASPSSVPFRSFGYLKKKNLFSSVPSAAVGSLG